MSENRTTTLTLEERMRWLASEWRDIGGIWISFANDLDRELDAHAAALPRSAAQASPGEGGRR